MTNSLSNVNGKFYKECQVVMLPTDKSSVIKKNIKINILDFSPAMMNMVEREWQPQHLYILSDEEIKEGDYYHNDRGFISKCDNIEQQVKLQREFESFYAMKVIATTDTSLTKEMYSVSSGNYDESLPRPSNEFLEAYVKAQGKIDKVLVEYRPNNHHEFYKNNKEWYYYLKVAPDNTISIKKLQNEFSKESVLNWLETRFTKEAPLEYIINEYKKEFLNGK